MAKIKVFTSFDYDHDSELRDFLIGQAKNDKSPFEISDYSLKGELSGDWKAKIKERIKKVDQVAVICGEHTDTATGVSAEVLISQELGKPYFLLKGRNGKICVKPKAAKSSDKIYSWTWENLKLLLAGKR